MAKVKKEIITLMFQVVCTQLSSLRWHFFFCCKKPEENQSNFLLGLLNEAGDDNYKDLGDGNDSMRTKTQGALELYERDLLRRNRLQLQSF